MIMQSKKTNTICFNVSIWSTLVALRCYKAAIIAFLGFVEPNMNIKRLNSCFEELDYLTGMHIGVATWVYYRELKQSTNTNQTKHEAREQKELFVVMLKNATKSVDEILKQITENIEDFEKNELMSCQTLSYAYMLYDTNDKQKALQMLQKCLDTEILISVKSCKFCEQVKYNGVDMLKCSFCNVTRFCNKVCQKGAYCKRPNLKMAITLSHGSLCPLLKTWKQVKKGNATVKSCVEQQLLFLQTCDPLCKVLDKNDFVDMDN